MHVKVNDGADQLQSTGVAVPLPDIARIQILAARQVSHSLLIVVGVVVVDFPHEVVFLLDAEVELRALLVGPRHAL